MYEYKTENVSHYERRPGVGSAIEQVANLMAADGWRVVGFTDPPEAGYAPTLLLEREVKS